MKGSTAKRLARSTIHWNTWGEHFAIAAAYAACYELTRHISLPQWLLTAGLRLACLFLLPVRYWPALALGEGLPLVENAVLCTPKFGIPWAVSASVPMIVLWMALLKPMRQRWTLYEPTGRVRMPMILGATLGTAVITAAATTLTLLTALLTAAPGKWPEISTQDYFWAYLLGSYLGALTLTPVILALHERFHALQGKPLSVTLIWRSPLLHDVLWWAVPSLAAIAWLALATHDDGVRQVARLALLLPAAGLAWRHGWHGTAVGGMGASVALAFTAQDILDPAMLRVQVILAIALSGALIAGTRASRGVIATPTAPASLER